MKDVTIEEVMRVLNELENRTTFLSETKGYSARRLSIVNRPGRITQPISYEVRLKERQRDETDKITETEFTSLYEAVRFYNSIV